MSKYIIAVMGALIAYLGISYLVHERQIDSLHGKVKTITEERDLAASAAEKNRLSLVEYIQSCEDTISVINTQMDRERTLSKAQESTLEKLLKKSPVTPKGALKDEVKSAQKQTNGAVFDLDPEYVRLLNDAYCEGNTDDPYCSTEVTVDGVQSSNKSGRK